MNLIDTTKELEKSCKILKKQKIIAIDCEFIREKTYYPIPCLIQVGYSDGAILIDAQAKEMDISPFFAILQNKKILKVFHSGRQDIEILYNLSGRIPTPVFDTQIAAQVCGLGESVSYENLVRKYCEVELDKSCRLTNWQIRPLTEEQLQYAAGDVTHLLTCYEKMLEYMKENHREDWIAEEMADLVDIKHYSINPEDVWLRIRHNIHATPFLNALKALACWREKRAIKQNVSRQSIIKDDMLLNIATAFPKSEEEMKQVRGMRSDIVRSVLATEMIEVLTNLETQGFDKSLAKQDREKDVSLPANSQSLYEILRLLLKIKSNEYGVVAHLISSEKNLRDYIKNPKKNIILNGWRYEVFGKMAEGFRHGDMLITYNPKTHSIEFAEK
ncbi:MAG: ribonuclease D [Alphaproteobacteria bacterium]|nr:ribonuclease D [Alphaproteobacteria bacterium]